MGFDGYFILLAARLLCIVSTSLSLYSMLFENVIYKTFEFVIAFYKYDIFVFVSLTHQNI